VIARSTTEDGGGRTGPSRLDRGEGRMRLITVMAVVTIVLAAAFERVEA